MSNRSSIKGFIGLPTLFFLLFSCPFAASIVTKMSTADRIYSQTESVPTKPAALVLGAAAYPSRLSDVLQDRMDTALELYLTGKVQKLILSGAPNEVEKMKEYAETNGVRAEDIAEDSSGLNTLASVKNISASHKNLIIVTQSFHLPRALMMARHFGVDAVGLSADRHVYLKDFLFRMRELFATTKAMMEMSVLSFPRFSGRNL